MNLFGVISGICLIGAGYWVGWAHGYNSAEYDAKPLEPAICVPVASPHASVCAAMLEAAWSIEDVTPPISPHKP